MFDFVFDVVDLLIDWFVPSPFLRRPKSITRRFIKRHTVIFSGAMQFEGANPRFGYLRLDDLSLRLSVDRDGTILPTETAFSRIETYSVQANASTRKTSPLVPGASRRWSVLRLAGSDTTVILAYDPRYTDVISYALTAAGVRRTPKPMNESGGVNEL